MAMLTERESEQVEAANATGTTPVVFIHGLWLLASSWDRWAAVFEEAGYAPLTPGWPDDPQSVEEARGTPQTFAGKGVVRVASHFAAVIDRLDQKPVIVGHSFGGLIAQILAGRGLSLATVAVDPAPFRGVLPSAAITSSARRPRTRAPSTSPPRNSSAAGSPGSPARPWSSRRC